MVFKKGNIPWNKGLSGDPRVLKNVMDAAKTRKEHKIPAWNKGLTKDTNEIMEQITIKIKKRFQKGYTPWNKGKTADPTKPTYDPRLRKNRPGWPKGKSRSKESIEKMRKTKLERKLPAWNKGLTKETDPRVAKQSRTQKGNKFTEEHKKNISLSRFRMPEEKRKKLASIAGTASMNKLTKAERVERALNAFSHIPRKNTSIEKILRKELIKQEVSFKEQRRISTISYVDFFIPPNLCVFADGDYWHSYPQGREKDRRQTKLLEKKGYKVLRFWGSEIRENPEQCVETILEAVSPPDSYVPVC